MKVIIPVAGLGSRLKPHTFTTPKPLMEVAGKPILEYVLEKIIKLNPEEIILIIGYHKDKIKDYLSKNYPKLNIKLVEQKVMDGDGGAIREGLKSIKKDDELYIIFGADTLIDFNLKKELNKLKPKYDAIIFSKKVKNPSNYGILNLDSQNEIISVQEKPENPKSDLAIIGAYYFKSLIKVKNYLNEFYENNIKVKNEFKIVQVIGKYIKNEDLKITTAIVDEWFDCGRPEVLLDANKYFLEKNSKNRTMIKKQNFIIIPPVYISKSAKIENCIIGPFASIGDNCNLKNTIVKYSIINSNSNIKKKILNSSIVGKEVILEGKSERLNIGDRSEIILE